MYAEIAILAAFAGFYAATAGGVERTPFNGALVFVLFGLVLAWCGIHLLDGEGAAGGLKLVAELSLALVLFVDASKTNFATLVRSQAVPMRLILFALPLVIIFGFFAGLLLIDGVSLLGLALLATLLAPTDAALGKPVVTSPQVPANIRESLSFESGLNDGVCVPIFLALMALSIGQTGETGEIGFTVLLAELIVEEIGIGALTGLAVAAVAAFVMRFSYRAGWISENWMHVPVAATAIAAFTAAQALHGSGFIAAFVGGLLFGYVARDDRHELVEAAEVTGDVLTMITWIVFGAALLWRVQDAFTWQMLAYAVLSLTVIRMVPVWLVLRNQPLSLREILFIGWFGPRGLATIVFAMMIILGDVPGAEIIVATASLTVLLSVVLHGITALPIIRGLFAPGSKA